MNKYNEVFEKIVLNPETQTTDKERIIHHCILHSQKYCGYDRLKDPNNLGEYISKVPDPDNVTLEEAIQDSLQRLEIVAGNKIPTLFLSGGIDSTAVFYALLQLDKPFNVVNNGGLEMEYPLLYEQLESGYYSNVTFRSEESDTLFKKMAHNENLIIVTGEIGDQIMGSMTTMEFSYEERNMPLSLAIKKDTLKKLYQFKYPGNFTIDCIKLYRNVLNWLKKTEDTCTVAEFLWAVNFIYKYLLVIYRLYLCDIVQYGPDKNAYHFFDTKKFQQYAISHYKENCAYQKPYEYKQPLKDWIYSQNHDESYKKWKTKIPSLMFASYWINK